VGQYRASISETWLQGRGAFGGLIAGLFARAIEQEFAAQRATGLPVGAPAERQLRILTCHLCEPVPPGPVELTVEFVRSGKYVSHVRATMSAKGGLVAFASATLASDRPGAPLAFEHAQAPSAELVERAPAILNRGLEPVFSRNFEFRLAGGAAPFSGSTSSACFCGWTRYRGTAELLSTAMVAALLDAWPPAVFATTTSPRPAATMALTYHFLRPPARAPVPESGFYLVTTAAEESLGGYSAQHGELWTPDGRVLARAHQMFAVIK
jgi:acyl-CoA thioesterase